VILGSVLTSAAGVADEDLAAVVSSTGGKSARHSEIAAEVAFEGAVEIPDLDGVDINVVPAQDREKRLLIADMDSTIISVECIDELADFVGKKAEVSEITERAMQGELDFEEALDARVSLLTGITRDQIAACAAERVRLNPGAETLVKTMAKRGAMTALVSGGFTVFTGPVAAEAGFAMNKANTLNFDGDALNGTVSRPIVTAATKQETLHLLAADHGIPLTLTLAVGDGANDALMVNDAGLGAAYRAKPKLREVADITLDHSDLTALLSIQGIRPSEFY